MAKRASLHFFVCAIEGAVFYRTTVKRKERKIGEEEVGLERFEAGGEEKERSTVSLRWPQVDLVLL